MLFQRDVFDTGKDAETVSPLDETEQSPRHRPSSATNGAANETENTPNAADMEMEGGSGDENGRASGRAETAANDLDAAAREYDKNGQVGEPPDGWKPDYSHWDTWDWHRPVEKVDILERIEGATALVYRPSEESRQRSKEIDDEHLAAIENGLITGKPRKGYVKRVFDDGDDVAYVAASFVDRFDALVAEDMQLNKNAMREEPTIAYTGGGSLGYNNKIFEIYYYREKDGSLTRKVFLNFKKGKSEKFKVSPPPDLEALGFEPIDIEHQKNRWKAYGGLNFFRDEYRKGE